MLTFYQKIAKFYHNDKEYYRNLCGLIVTSETPKPYKEYITWENLDTYFRQGKLPFCTYYDRKKGKIFSYGDKFFDDDYFFVVEWQEELNIQIEYIFIPTNPPIEKILKYPDGEMAIQYLAERGLSIVGK